MSWPEGSLPLTPGLQQQAEFRRQMGIVSPPSSVPHGPAFNDQHQASPLSQFNPHTPGSTQFQFPSTPAYPIMPMVPPPSPPPLPPDKPYQIASSGKLDKAAVVREFVLVETRIQDLEYKLKLAKQGNATLRNDFAVFTSHFDSRIRQIEKKYDERLALMATDFRAKMDTYELDNQKFEEIDSEVEDEKGKMAREEAEISKKAANHTKIKALATAMYCKFLGKAKLSEKSDLPVIDEDFDESNLPLMKGSQDIHEVRLYWDKPAKDSHNHQAISTIVGFAKSHGRQFVSEAGELLDVIQPGDLHARFVKKFQALQKIYRETTGKKSTKPGGELTKNKRDNRARGKLDVRERKRQSLPKDSEWRSEKYDAVFAIQQMSDDEDTYLPDGKLDPNHFTSRAPLYRSELVNELFAAIDDCPDIKSSTQFAKRTRGDPKEQPLPATKFLKGRARRWMIDPNWLQSNKKFDDAKYIADNGKLWGDSQDPEETEELIKQSAMEKAVKKSKRKQVGEAGPSQKRARGDEGSEGDDDVFA